MFMHLIEKQLAMIRLFLFLLCLSASVNAQIADMPEANFKTELIEYRVDTNADGEIQ